jgi:hypothetical protein
MTPMAIAAAQPSATPRTLVMTTIPIMGTVQQTASAMSNGRLVPLSVPLGVGGCVVIVDHCT